MPVCPFRCGECCKHDEWVFLFKEDILEYGRKLREQTEAGWTGTIEEAWNRPECLFLREGGCLLPRNKRPSICRNYLCTRAIDALKERRKKCPGKPSRPSRGEASASPARSSSPAR